jgi:desulfoferrodoxin (superoxide reductase-like protein)
MFPGGYDTPPAISGGSIKIERKEKTMEISRRKWIGLMTSLAFTGYAAPALADQSTVTIEAPDQAARGEEIVVKLNVTHSGNSFFHYTNWVHAKVNGKDTFLRDYSMTNRPPAANFSLEFKLVVNQPLEITAEANCNLHGSKGPASKKIGLKA